MHSHGNRTRLLRWVQSNVFVKEKGEDNAKFWAEIVPGHVKKLEATVSKRNGGGDMLKCFSGICGPNSAAVATFTSSGTSPGELLLFACLDQMSLVNSGFMRNSPGLSA